MGIIDQITAFTTPISQIAVTFLTLGLFYYNWSSPKTGYYSHDISDWQDKGRGPDVNLMISLRNEGLSETIFRVVVYLDSEKLFKDHFRNCLFAANPEEATATKGGLRGRRGKVAKGDFMKFSNWFSWIQENKAMLKKEDFPVSEGFHIIRLEVDQTGENYIFQYEGDGKKVVEGSDDFIVKYGGKTISGMVWSFLVRPLYEDVNRLDIITKWFRRKAIIRFLSYKKNPLKRFWDWLRDI